MKIEQAMELARRFHEGAQDRAGRPYIEHVERVVNSVVTHDEKLAVASPPRCKSEMGVGSFQELTTQKGNPHPCLNEYHPSRLSVQR
jgi:hypothetical protein